MGCVRDVDNFFSLPGAPSPMTKDQELQSLKNQAQAVSQQLNQINKRIKELEKKGR